MFHTKLNIKGGEKIIKQKIGKIEKINLSKGSNAKILFPLLVLSLMLVFSFAVNDVSAANGTSTNTIGQTNPVSSSINGKTTDLQSQSTSETTKKASNTNKKTANLNSQGIGTVNISNLNYNMGINLTTSDISPNVGQQYYYTVIVTNNGPDNATGVQVKSGMPYGIKFNSYSTSQGTYDNPTGKWNIGYLASGASAVLQLFVTPTNRVNGTVVTKTATLVNTKETVNTTVSIPGSPVSDVALSLTASNLTPKVGQQFYYTLIATNNGPDLASNVQVTSWIPTGLTINSVTVTEGSFSTLPQYGGC
ncbi:MAG: DUF11 domain-containing protein [Methanobacterium sp. ERen5]|nr:MAG: DUF11 domain-containing protein [Methanobacterium sp. ERen5]